MGVGSAVLRFGLLRSGTVGNESHIYEKSFRMPHGQYLAVALANEDVRFSAVDQRQPCISLNKPHPIFRIMENLIGLIPNRACSVCIFPYILGVLYRTRGIRNLADISIRGKSFDFVLIILNIKRADLRGRALDKNKAGNDTNQHQGSKRDPYFISFHDVMFSSSLQHSYQVRSAPKTVEIKDCQRKPQSFRRSRKAAPTSDRSAAADAVAITEAPRPLYLGGLCPYRNRGGMHGGQGGIRIGFDNFVGCPPKLPPIDRSYT